MLYLGIPWLIFCLSWLKWGWALLAFLCLSGPFFLYIREMKAKTRAGTFSRKEILAVGLLGAILALFSGLTYHFPQAMDYVKHHEVWQDLLDKDWPVLYQGDEGLHFLDYYLAYYLPAAWVAKFFDTGYQLPSLLWALLGLYICLFGFLKLFPLRPILGLVLFFLVAGQDLLWIWAIDLLHLLKTGQYSPLPWGEIIVEPEAYLSFIYKGPFDHLLWAPQHALGGWISSLLVFSCLKDRNGKWLSALPLVLSFFWSPFVTIGLLPFVLWDLLHARKPSPQKILLAFCLLLPGLIVLLYYQAHQPPGYTGFVWEVGTRSNWFFFYLLFIFFELAAYAALVMGNWRSHPPKKLDRQLFFLALTSLLLIPFFHIGRANDFVMRVSIPALIVLYASSIRALFEGWKIKFLRPFFVLSFALGMVLPFVEAYKVWHKEIPLPVQEIFPLSACDLTRLNEAYEVVGVSHDFDLSKQYLGDSASLFYHYFLKRPSDEVESKSP